MDAEQIKAFVEEPPDHARRLAFQYRQAIGARQQAEARLREARAAVAAAQQDVARAQGEYVKRLGVEQGYQEAVVAIMDPEGDDVVHLPTGTEKE